MIAKHIVALTLLAAACGHPGPGGSTPTGGGSGGGGAKAPVVVNELAPGAPLVTPGEHMTYKLVLQGIEIASYELVVGAAPEAVGGKQAITVTSHAKAVGIASMAVKVDDNFTSWVDVATGRSLKWHTDEFAKNGKDKEITDADLAAKTADSIPITFHVNDEAPVPEPQKLLPTMKEVWDYNAFLVALRSWEGAIGSKISVEVLRSRYLWHVDMTIKGKEKLVTDMGEFPALRLEAVSFKYDRDGGRNKETEDRPFTIWVSDDAGRVPLQVVAKTDYGDLKMSITTYEPGNGTPLRQ